MIWQPHRLIFGWTVSCLVREGGWGCSDYMFARTPNGFLVRFLTRKAAQQDADRRNASKTYKESR